MTINKFSLLPVKVTLMGLIRNVHAKYAILCHSLNNDWQN